MNSISIFYNTRFSSAVWIIFESRLSLKYWWVLVYKRIISERVFDKFGDKKQCLDSTVGKFVNLVTFHQTNKNIPWQL